VRDSKLHSAGSSAAQRTFVWSGRVVPRSDNLYASRWQAALWNI